MIDILTTFFLTILSNFPYADLGHLPLSHGCDLESIYSNKAVTTTQKHFNEMSTKLFILIEQTIVNA